MVKESLPLLIALSLPLVGAAGLLPAAGPGRQPVPVSAPAAAVVSRPVLLQLPLQVLAAPLPVAGVWLNF